VTTFAKDLSAELLIPVTGAHVLVRPEAFWNDEEARLVAGPYDVVIIPELERGDSGGTAFVVIDGEEVTLQLPTEFGDGEWSEDKFEEAALWAVRHHFR